jgi:Uma2 family endonuclease
VSATAPVRKHTWSDYLAFPTQLRRELIDGEAFAMGAPSVRHQRVVLKLAAQLDLALADGRCTTLAAPISVRLPRANERNEDIDSVVEPDIVVVCDRRKLDSAGVRGAPDFIIEVISPSCAAHDHLRKRLLYEQAQVREYWLVHPIDGLVTRYSLENDRFGAAQIDPTEGVFSVGSLPGLALDFGFFATLPELDGSSDSP